MTFVTLPEHFEIVTGTRFARNAKRGQSGAGRKSEWLVPDVDPRALLVPALLGEQAGSFAKALRTVGDMFPKDLGRQRAGQAAT